MPTTVFTAFLIAFFLMPLAIHEPATPLVPNTAVASPVEASAETATTTVANETVPVVTPAPSVAAKAPAKVAAKTEIKKSGPSTPLRVRIPKISVNSPIQKMGVTSNGDLDVPDGSTKNIGWYAKGTVPGNVGSAVFDAHVFAALKNLRYALPGTDVYVDMSNGETLHFKIEESTVYPLANVPADQLFNRSDEPRLNIITCAGKLTADHSTYDHRLIAYAVLMD
jgi:hypothetical protein